MRLLFSILAALSITMPMRGDTEKADEARIIEKVKVTEASFRELAKTATYCTAFALGDEPKRDPATFLDPQSVIQVGEVAKRIAVQKRLMPEQIQQVLAATFQGKEGHSQSACYEPHHLFVFYAANDMPVAAVELCLTCGGLQISPFGEDDEVSFRLMQTADLKALAKVLDDAGVPLTPFESLADYTAGR